MGLESCSENVTKLIMIIRVVASTEECNVPTKCQSPNKDFQISSTSHKLINIWRRVFEAETLYRPRNEGRLWQASKQALKGKTKGQQRKIHLSNCKCGSVNMCQQLARSCWHWVMSSNARHDNLHIVIEAPIVLKKRRGISRSIRFLSFRGRLCFSGENGPVRGSRRSAFAAFPVSEEAP